MSNEFKTPTPSEPALKCAKALADGKWLAADTPGAIKQVAAIIDYGTQLPELLWRIKELEDQCKTPTKSNG